MLAPLDTSTGDGRRFLSSGVSNRQLPLPLRWQRYDGMGHEDSVVIGSCAEINYGTVAEAIENGWIDAKCIKDNKYAADMSAVWGAGILFDPDPQKMPRLAEDIAEATLLLEQGVIGPSADPGSAQAAIAEKGSDKPLSEQELDDLFWSEDGASVELEMLFTEYQIAAATLVPIPAFGECRPFNLFDMTEVITAAVRDTWSGLPIAERDLEWDSTAAEKRIAESAGIGGDNPDWDTYAQAFLYRNSEADPETKNAYGFQIADLVDGEIAIVPRAVFAVAGVLQGARGGTTIPEADQNAMRAVVEELYERMAEQFEDDTITVPWDGEEAALIAALSVTPNRFRPELFGDPRLTSVTPVTVTDDGEVFGHIATHDTCHVGIRHECVTAPTSARTYMDFHRYVIPGEDGSPITVGRITTGGGQHVCPCAQCRGSNDDHACLRLTAAGAIAHHDNMETVAWVRVGEDETNNAIWVHGSLNPDASVDAIGSLTRARVSGDWRPIAGGSELVEVLSLARERPGFPLPRIRMSHGTVAALTAAGMVRPRPVDIPAAIPVGIDYERLGRIVASHLAPIVAASDAAVVDADPVADVSDPADVDTMEDVDTTDAVAVDVAAVAAEVVAAIGAADAAAAARLVDEIGRY